MFKTALFALLTTASVAMAAPESVSYLCNGTQLAPGGGGQTGTISIKASTQGQTTFNSPWDFAIGWQGGSPITGAGLACGATLPKAIACDVTRSGAGLPFSLSQQCGGTIFDSAFPHPLYATTLVMDGDHGRISCDNYDTGVFTFIEITGCKVP